VVGVSRLSRAELQLRTRAKVLAAARAEFAEHGYGDTTIDRIAARADLTRGAVYSNFPGKRALYLSTLIPTDQRAAYRGTQKHVEPAHGDVNSADGLAAFASAWLDHEHPSPEVLPELADVGPQYAGLLGLNAVLLGLALDRLEAGRHQLTLGGLDPLAPGGPDQLTPGSLDQQASDRLGRLIGIARLALTTLAGATQLTAAPGFVQPLAVTRACAALADLDLLDPWTPPPTTPAIRPADELLDTPDGPTDAPPDGIVAILGLARLTAAEDLVRTTTAPVTIALVSSDPDELGPLTRYTTGTLLSCLQQSLPAPRIRLVHDYDGVLASSVGCEVIADELEYAVLVQANRIIARAEGLGAAHAMAAAQAAISPTPSVSTPTASDAAPSQRIPRN
jgi:AcrR family transcriptional regulator